MSENKVYTIKDIALQAGVSPSTVSRVLRQKTTAVKITEQTRNRIMQAAQELRYTPNVNAQRLVRRGANTIALVLPSRTDSTDNVFSDSFLNLLLRGMEEVMIARKCRLLIEFKHDSYVADREYLRIFNEGSIDGMLVWGATVNDAYLAELEHLPVLQVGSCYRRTRKMNYLGHDVEQGSFMVADHLLRQGRRKIACVWGPEYSSISSENREGVLRALREFGVKPAAEVTIARFLQQEGERIMEELLQSGRERFDAVIFPTNGLAIGGHVAALRHGLTVPQDLAFGGGSGGETDFEWLTTYAVKEIAIGHLAAERVFAMIEHKVAMPCQEYLPVKLIHK